MCEQLRGQVAIVTGGGSGIGAAIATEFARQGATVIVAERDSAAAERVTASCASEPGTVIAHQVDVLDEGQVVGMVDSTVDTHGRLDVLVNVVGGSNPILVEDMPADEWDRMLAFNLKSAFLCVRAVIPTMRRQGSGRIINVSSNMGFSGAVGRAHYAAAKAGIVGFTKSLALELGQHGITVNALAPGLTNTARVRSKFTDEAWASIEATIPLRRTGRPEDMAPLVALLASAGGSYITGQTIHVNGGMVMP